MNTLFRKLRGSFRRSRLDREMDEEMRFHIEEQTRRNLASGMSPAEAARAARRQFGGGDRIREEAREARGWMWLEDFVRDLRHAARALWKSPGFTTIAVITLALGIGMNTAMFSVLNGLLLRPLTLPEPERLFRLAHVRPPEALGGVAPGNLADAAAASSDIAELAAFRFWAFTVTDEGRVPDVPNAVRVTENYFRVLGQAALLGRTFAPDDAIAGRDDVVVLSHRYWQSYFGGDPDILGRVVRLDGAPVEIIGVLPAETDTIRMLAPIGLYRPFVWSDAERNSRSDASLGVIGRLRAGVALEHAATAYDTIARRLAADHPAENTDKTLVARPLHATLLQGVGRTVVLLLIGLAGFVLLIACANLANLLLARAMSRAREFSIRGALGASRAQLLKPLAAESLLLAGIGGVAALAVARWTSSWLALRFGGTDTPADFSVDGRVLAFTAAVSLVTALLFGVGPAWWMSRVDLIGALKSATRGATASRAQTRYRHALIATQFALTLVLLAGAGFFLRGLHRLINDYPGWSPEPVISGVVNLASARYNAAEPIINFHVELRERLMALPGVENAAVGFETPLYPSPARRAYFVEGRAPPPPGQEPSAFVNAVSASFLDTVGLRLLRGRFIDETDRVDSRQVVVINESMARALFPTDDAIGQRLGLVGLDDPLWAEIVGIVADTRSLRVTSLETEFQVYKPYPQESWQYVTIAVRVSNATIAPTLIEPIRKVVAAMDGDQPVLNLMTMPERIVDNVGFWRTINQLLGLFAALGLLLAALGIYGVTSRLVAQRTAEFGIRLALGAQVREIVRLVLSGGLRLSLAGTVVGLGGAWLFVRFLTARIPAFGGSALVPLTVASALLALVALLACWLPARRAAKVDPMVALRSE